MKFNRKVWRFLQAMPAALLLLNISGCSNDWPAFRHNILRSGAQLNTGPLTDPQKVATLAVGWTFPLPAAILSPPLGPFRASPIVYKGIVYIGNSNGFLYAIDASDGSLKWQYPAPGSQ